MMLSMDTGVRRYDGFYVSELKSHYRCTTTSDAFASVFPAFLST